jgi:hypothetical protein
MARTGERRKVGATIRHSVRLNCCAPDGRQQRLQFCRWPPWRCAGRSWPCSDQRPAGPCDDEPRQTVRIGDAVAIGVGRQHVALMHDNTYSCVRATASTL